MSEAVLTLNVGSSSLKFALFEVAAQANLRQVLRGEIQEMATSPRFHATDSRGEALAEERVEAASGSFEQLFERVFDWIQAHSDVGGATAVGHRVVHGGRDLTQPALVTTDLIDALDRLVPFAPLHEPQNIGPIRAISAIRPDLPQVVCFDTAFHHTMSDVVTRFALPRAYEAEGIRRYGFHGLSYEYVAGRLREVAPELSRGRVIVAHLGSGASLCAMSNGKSVDTTMGFSTLDGLVMGTRSGSLDPGVILHLIQQKGMTAKELENLLYRESGLLGVSGGIASDMRTLLASSDPHAADAVAVFVHRIAREICALAGTLGGLDGIVFTAGIGEHAPAVREAVCRKLRWLGVEIDLAANARNAPVISSPASRIEVRVIATDEERMIARHTLTVLGAIAEA